MPEVIIAISRDYPAEKPRIESATVKTIRDELGREDTTAEVIAAAKEVKEFMEEK